MPESLIARVLEFESTDPRRAGRLYEKAQRRNSRWYWTVFFLGILTPILSGWIAFHLARILESYQALVILTVFVIVGLSPPLATNTFLLFKNRSIDVTKSLRTISKVLLAGPRIAFEVALIGLFAGLCAAVAVLPIIVWTSLGLHLAGKPLDHPPFDAALTVLFFAAACVFFLAFVVRIEDWADLLPPVTGLRVLAAGVRLSLPNVVLVLTVLLSFRMLAGLGPLRLVADDLGQVLASSALVGILLAVSISRIERSWELGSIIRLGQARCDLRLGRWGAAVYRLMRAQAADHDHGDELVRILRSIADRRSSDLDTVNELLRAEASYPADGKGRARLWRANLEAIRSLAEGRGVFRRPLASVAGHRGPGAEQRAELGWKIMSVWLTAMAPAFFAAIGVAVGDRLWPGPGGYLGFAAGVIAGLLAVRSFWEVP